MNYKNKHFKSFETESESQFTEYSKKDVEKEKYINEKLSQLRIHKLLKKLNLDELLWD